MINFFVAKRLLKKGFSYKEIAEKTGIPYSTIVYNLNPKRRKKVCFCLLRSGLKRKTILKKEVKKILKEFEKGG